MNLHIMIHIKIFPVNMIDYAKIIKSQIVNQKHFKYLIIGPLKVINLPNLTLIYLESILVYHHYHPTQCIPLIE